MKIYVLMCLEELVGDNYYMNEEEAEKELYRALEATGSGDFWIKELKIAELVEIEEVFVQRANEIRNPLSGEELLNEAVRLLKESEEDGNSNT